MNKIERPQGDNKAVQYSLSYKIESTCSNQTRAPEKDTYHSKLSQLGDRALTTEYRVLPDYQTTN
jgi:hypothetical protein